MQLQEQYWDYKNSNATTRTGMQLQEQYWNYKNSNATTRTGMQLQEQYCNYKNSNATRPVMQQQEQAAPSPQTECTINSTLGSYMYSCLRVALCLSYQFHIGT
ncbi:hypothetical protein PoB_001584800 [Plakobranchus ocellatus]|uniref:Uncharacterized protein n=1 Tax=Plakobranchus ocellatus TaxID=259542 RepID=A0AAV3Z3L9_9GAST|nr:hypothetical protein PoB_001584800 [Plakobranchus ocellatus]